MTEDQPFSPQPRRQLTCIVTLSHSVTFCIMLLLVSGLAPVGLAEAATGWLVVVLIGMSCFLFLTASAGAIWCVVFRPKLLTPTTKIFDL